MKKFVLILLTGLICCSFFACTDKQNTQSGSSPMLIAVDTVIQDSGGTDKCFWEDGSALWSNYSGKGNQHQKSAVLAVNTEYDMFFYDDGREMKLSDPEYYYPTEFEYDETKIEIKVNPDEANHFIIKVLQPCAQERVVSKITDRSPLDDMVYENGEPVQVPVAGFVTITISTEA
ncbi:MAG: hypothetical protein NC184_03415 [Roseburia sp.]|nr:hypothetical protein [Roseburia sp.]